MSRSLISRIKLLEQYKKDGSLRFQEKKEKELENLHTILSIKITDELALFQKYPSPEVEKFLSIVCNEGSNYTTQEQKDLFSKISHQNNNKAVAPVATCKTAHEQAIISFIVCALIYLLTQQAIFT